MDQLGPEADLPEGVEYKSVKVQGNSDAVSTGKAAIKVWSPSERSERARKRTLKIVGWGVLIGLPFLLVPVVHFIAAPLLILVMGASVPLYFKFRREKSTFFQVEAKCLYCGKNARLRPFVDSGVEEKITVQCPRCGQTMRALF